MTLKILALAAAIVTNSSLVQAQGFPAPKLTAKVTCDFDGDFQTLEAIRNEKMELKLKAKDGVTALLITMGSFGPELKIIAMNVYGNDGKIRSSVYSRFGIRDAKMTIYKLGDGYQGEAYCFVE